MQRYQATSVDTAIDTDHGEGLVVFQWPDELYGHDELRIDLDGHCSRRMPIRSGDGPPEFVKLERDRIQLRFDPKLAGKLELAEEVEILFHFPNVQFAELQKLVEYFSGELE